MASADSRCVALRSRVRALSRTVRGVKAGDARAVHQARVASRRLRASLALLAGDHEAGRKLRKALRHITGELGTTRQQNVLSTMVDALGTSAAVSNHAVDALANVIGTLQAGGEGTPPAAAIEQVVRKLSRFTTELDRDFGAVDVTADDQPWRERGRIRLAALAATVHATVTEAGTLYQPGRLHQIRIAVKKLRYGLEVALEVDGPGGRGDVAVLRRLQTRLGELHDLDVFVHHVRRVRASVWDDQPAVAPALDAVVDRSERKCRRIHAWFLHHRHQLLELADRYRLPPVTRVLSQVRVAG